MLSPRLSVQVADDFPEFPLGHQPSLWNLRNGLGNAPFCSAPSSVVRRCQTARQRACKDYGHGPSPTDPIHTFASDAAELSRFSNIECPRMHRFFDSVGPGNDWLVNVATYGAFPRVVLGRRPGWVISELNSWPALPLSTLHVRPRGRPRMTRGHDGSAHPSMLRDFHPLLYAGLSRRFHYVPQVFSTMRSSPLYAQPTRSYTPSAWS